MTKRTLINADRDSMTGTTPDGRLLRFCQTRWCWVNDASGQPIDELTEVRWIDLDAEPARKTRSVAFNPLRGRIEEVHPEDEVPAEDLIRQHWSETLQRWVTIPDDDATG